jgi:hypothetical protein
MSSVDAGRSTMAGGELPVSRRTFDAVVSVFSLLLVVGVALDFRAHANGISFAEEGFFTPQHVFFYTAFLGVAGTLFLGTYVRRRAGRDWIAAVPEGYGLAAIGVLVFGFGGVGDFFWHSAFGFEQGFEALVSPSHIALGSGAVLFLAAPMQAAAARAEPAADSLVGAIPVVVSLTLVLTMLGLFGGFVNPLYRPYPHYEYYTMQSVVTMLVAFPLLYLGSIVFVCRRFGAIPGAFTLIFGASSLAIAQVQGFMALVVPAVVAGVVADVIVAYTHPFAVSRWRVRALAAAVPAAFVTAYFAVVDLQWGIDHTVLVDGMVTWSVHVVGGAVVLASIAGLLFGTVVTVDGVDSRTEPVDDREGS